MQKPIKIFEDCNENLIKKGDFDQFSKQKNIYIEKYFDISEKYGIVYRLNNGLIGVSFNDRSKIIMHFDLLNFTYIEKNFENKEFNQTTYKTNDFPDKIKKKSKSLFNL